MAVSTNEMIHFEDAYASFALPAVEPLTPPYLIQQPQNLGIPPGSTAVFTAYPAGDAFEAHQWRFMDGDIPGATNSSLTLNNIIPANEGYYYLIVSNAAGTVVSSNAVLSVQVPPPLAYRTFCLRDREQWHHLRHRIRAHRPDQRARPDLVSRRPELPGLATQPTIITGNLENTSLADATGNSVKFGGNSGIAARLEFFRMVQASRTAPYITPS